MAPIKYKIWYQLKGKFEYEKLVFFQSDEQFKKWKMNRYSVLKEKYNFIIYQKNKKTGEFDKINLD